MTHGNQMNAKQTNKTNPIVVWFICFRAAKVFFSLTFCDTGEHEQKMQKHDPELAAFISFNCGRDHTDYPHLALHTHA